MPCSNWPPHPGLRGIRLSIFTASFGNCPAQHQHPYQSLQSLTVVKILPKGLVINTNANRISKRPELLIFNSSQDVTYKWGVLDLQLPLPAPEHQGEWRLSASKPNWSQTMVVSMWVGHCKVSILSQNWESKYLCYHRDCKVQQIAVLHTRETTLRKPETSDPYCWLNLICESALISILHTTRFLS